MIKDVLKIILGLVMILLFVGGIALILADEVPGETLSISRFIWIKVTGFSMFYLGTVIYKKVQWRTD